MFTEKFKLFLFTLHLFYDKISIYNHNLEGLFDMYSGYNAISDIYDKINAEVDYKVWADYFEACFKKYLNEKPSLILDLACGTGSMTLELAERGYDMIGADGSEDMLMRAMDNAYDRGISGVLFICQDMRSFELYGTVGAITACLDSINYLTTDKDIEDCFSSVHNYLDPDGLFLFDLNTPYKFEHIYADNSYIHEINDSDAQVSAYCGWQNEYDKNTGLCNFYLTVFTEKDDGSYAREDEVQTERAYTLYEIKTHLENTGFELLGVFGGFDFSKPTPTSERWHIVARAKKQ